MYEGTCCACGTCTHDIHIKYQCVTYSRTVEGTLTLKSTVYVLDNFCIFYIFLRFLYFLTHSEECRTLHEILHVNRTYIHTWYIHTYYI